MMLNHCPGVSVHSPTTNYVNCLEDTQQQVCALTDFTQL